jgi:hypothetical protein
MTDLQTHINIFKGLGFVKHRNAIIRMVWQIATDHGKEISCEDFIKALTTTTNPVEPIRVRTEDVTTTKT